jgi:hypothetical protein
MVHVPWKEWVDRFAAEACATQTPLQEYRNRMGASVPSTWKVACAVRHIQPDERRRMRKKSRLPRIPATVCREAVDEAPTREPGLVRSRWLNRQAAALVVRACAVSTNDEYLSIVCTLAAVWCRNALGQTGGPCCATSVRGSVATRPQRVTPAQLFRAGH